MSRREQAGFTTARAGYMPRMTLGTVLTILIIVLVVVAIFAFLRRL